MKKRIFVILLSLVLLLFPATSCNTNSKSLIDHGFDVISLMAEMVENEDFKVFYNFPAAYDETIRKLRASNYSQCQGVYELTVSNNQLFDVSVGSDAMSERLYNYVQSSSFISFASSVNQLAGLEALAVSAAFCAQKTFVAPEEIENSCFLYVFENAYPITVFFLPGEDNTVRAIGYFILHNGLLTNSAQDIENALYDMGIPDVTVKKQ